MNTIIAVVYNGLFLPIDKELLKQWQQKCLWVSSTLLDKSRGEVEHNHSESPCVFYVPNPTNERHFKTIRIKSNLGTVVAFGNLSHHGLCAAWGFRGLCDFLFLPGPHNQNDQKNDEQNGEEKSDQNSYDYHKPVVVALPVIQFSRNDTLGLGFPVEIGMPLSAVVQCYMQDVCATVVLRTDFLSQIRNAIGWPSVAWLAVENGVAAVRQRMIFNASFPNASVCVISGSDGVNSVNVPLSSCRHLERV